MTFAYSPYSSNMYLFVKSNIADMSDAIKFALPSQTPITKGLSFLVAYIASFSSSKMIPKA